MEIFKNKYFYIATAIIIVYFVVVRPLINGKKDKVVKMDFLEDIEVNPNLVTLNLQTAQDLANKMMLEMDGINWMVNRKFWDEVLDTVQTKDDAKMVVKAFGVRDDQTLLQWIKNEPSLQTAGLMKSLINRFDV